MQVDTTVAEPVAKVILATGQVDGETLKISQIQNDKRAESRKKIKEAGMNTTAYGMGVRVAKMMLNQGEREDFIRDFLITVEVLTKSQVELFPHLAIIADKRRAKAAARAAREAAKNGTETPEQQQRRLAADANPRSNPDRGGAKPQTKKAAKKSAPKGDGSAADRAEETSDQNKRLEEAANSSAGASPGKIMAAGAAQSDAALKESIAAAEQKEGGDILDTAIDNMKGADGQPKSQSQIAREKLEAVNGKSN
jgi:hypothetical protein